ncbi:MAG: helix-turn-helix transcriptional regulator [Ruminococcus sp.]|nr:helix-turn-helix transcriptional regulator [Ruminococcus sp.]
MSSNQLGRRIKEARLAKRLTQSEVVGDFITRNMLSQIESGTALPSVKTLQYLSRVLEVPMSQLMPEEEASADGAAEYVRIRELFRSGELKAMQDTAIPEGFEDEMKALKAKALLAMAKEYDERDKSSVQKSAERAREAAKLADEGIYANAAVKSEALVLLGELAQKLTF